MIKFCFSTKLTLKTRFFFYNISDNNTPQKRNELKIIKCLKQKYLVISIVPSILFKKYYIQYKILKHFKYLKRNVLKNPQIHDDLALFGLQLQTNKFYLSINEINRNFNNDAILINFKAAVISMLLQTYVSQTNRLVFFSTLLIKKNRLKKKGFSLSFSQFCLEQKYKQTSPKFPFFISYMKRKGFFNKFIRSQVLVSTTKKKKYKKTFLLPKSNQKKIDSLLTVFLKSRLYFVKKKKQNKKNFKKLAWKRRKRRKWKNILNRFRDRQRFLKKFYIPRHLEINFKTLSLAHLGFFDTHSVEYRIPFWLNLRKLTTFFSS